jgi:hypothetical protein
MVSTVVLGGVFMSTLGSTVPAPGASVEPATQAVPSAPEDDLSLEIYAAGERSALLAELLDRPIEVVVG